MLEAYFDESERQAGTFCVAGYLFEPHAAGQFNIQWRKLFGGKVCHMVDLMSSAGVFEGLSDKEHNDLLKAAIPIINKHIKAGVAVSCNVSEVRQYAPAWLRGFGHAYPICCHLAMTALGHWLDGRKIKSGVIYFFESGHPYEAESRDFIASLVRVKEAKLSYHHRGDAFLEKGDAVPLQAADLLAWEWAKCQDETIEQRLRPLRKSLKALFANDPKRYAVFHFTGPTFRKFFARTAVLGWEQVIEESIEKRHRRGPN